MEELVRMEKLNVAIADDNERMVDLLSTLVKGDKELELVGQAADGQERSVCQKTTGFYYYIGSRPGTDHRRCFSTGCLLLYYETF